MNKKLVFITGVSSGFGFLTVHKLLEGSSYKVIAVIRGGAKRGETIFKDLVPQIERGDLVFIDIDLDKNESLKNGLSLAKKYMIEGLDILINNAGFGLLGPLELQTQEQIRLQFETNFFAPMLIIQELIPFLQQRKGKILNMSSLVGFTVFPFYGTYGASKHALDSLTEALYYELSEFNIQVCAIEPGGFKTSFSSNTFLGQLQNERGQYYQKRITRFKIFLSVVVGKIEKDPNEVVQAIFHLCEKKRIPVRLRVGSEVHFNWFLKKIMPDQWRIKFQDWFYKKFFF